MIGLYIQHDIIRAVDIVKKSHGYILNSIAEQPVQLPVPERIRPLTDDEAQEFLQNFTVSLKAILSVRGFVSTEVALAIDIKNAFIHTVPFDGDFSEDNIKRLIEWELSQYFPDIESNDFLFDTYNPGFNPSKDQTPKFIYTAVLRPYIHLLQRGIRTTKLTLQSINVDHFTIEKFLKHAASEKQRERLNAICFRRNDILYCSLLWNHRLVRYREYTIDETYNPGKRIEMFLASLSGPQKNLDQRIYYHPFDDHIVEETEKNTGWQFDWFKPFDHFQLTRKARRRMPDTTIAKEGYTPAVAAALKGE